MSSSWSNLSIWTSCRLWRAQILFKSCLCDGILTTPVHARIRGAHKRTRGKKKTNGRKRLHQLMLTCLIKAARRRASMVVLRYIADLPQCSKNNQRQYRSCVQRRAGSEENVRRHAAGERILSHDDERHGTATGGNYARTGRSTRKKDTELRALPRSFGGSYATCTAQRLVSQGSWAPWCEFRLPTTSTLRLPRMLSYPSQRVHLMCNPRPLSPRLRPRPRGPTPSSLLLHLSPLGLCLPSKRAQTRKLPLPVHPVPSPRAG